MADIDDVMNKLEDVLDKVEDCIEKVNEVLAKDKILAKCDACVNGKVRRTVIVQGQPDTIEEFDCPYCGGDLNKLWGTISSASS
jgi:C4-type Zn-finger protein